MHGVEIVVKLISFNIRGHFSYLGILDLGGRWYIPGARPAHARARVAIITIVLLQ